MNRKIATKTVSFAALVILPVLFVGSCGPQGGGFPAGGQEIWSFDKDQAGSVPRGWKVAETAGQGKAAAWEVIPHESAPSRPQVVAITTNENRGSTYNLLIAEGTKYKDLQIRVMVKSDAGEEDRGGGPIWRAKDADNYYIARWNPLEDNFRVYSVKDGQRKQLGSADVKANPRTWHEITISHSGTKIVASLDGKQMIELEDSTFTEAGKVGLWVKADGKTAFDNLWVARLDPRAKDQSE